MRQITSQTNSLYRWDRDESWRFHKVLKTRAWMMIRANLMRKYWNRQLQRGNKQASYLFNWCGEWSELTYFFIFFSHPEWKEIYDRVETKRKNEKQTKFCFMIINLSHSTSIRVKFRCWTAILFEPFNFWISGWPAFFTRSQADFLPSTLPPIATKWFRINKILNVLAIKVTIQ